MSNSSEIAEDSTSWDIVGEYNDDLFIRCVLASKRNRSKEKGENDHTGLMDKADGSESDNAPTKLDKDASIEGKGNKEHPYTGSTVCIPCSTSGYDSMSSLSLSTAETRSPVAKIGQVDDMVSGILQSPERAISTIQEALNHPKVASYLENASVSGSASRKRQQRARDIAYNNVMSSMGNIGSDDQSKVIKMIAKNTAISEAIRKAGYVRSDESQVAMAQSVQQEKLVKIALQTEHEQGHAVDDKRAWVASSLSSAVLTPPSFQ